MPGFSNEVPVLRSLTRILLLVLVVGAGGYGVYLYEGHRSAQARLAEQVRKLEEQKKHLQDFVSRLTAEKRVAEIIVTEQIVKDTRIESTTLMFLEFARDGSRLPPRFFTIRGNVAHIDALVIKFNRDFIERNDPLRGHSIALFYRLFGDYQMPAEGYRIDDPGRPPAVYRGDKLNAAAAAFEAELWRDFWKLAEDSRLREEKGVSVAHGESPWTCFKPDRVYTLSIGSISGLNLMERPMDGLLREYRDALLRRKS